MQPSKPIEEIADSSRSSAQLSDHTGIYTGCSSPHSIVTSSGATSTVGAVTSIRVMNCSMIPSVTLPQMSSTW